MIEPLVHGDAFAREDFAEEVAMDRFVVDQHAVEMQEDHRAIMPAIVKSGLRRCRIARWHLAHRRS